MKRSLFAMMLILALPLTGCARQTDAEPPEPPAEAAQTEPSEPEPTLSTLRALIVDGAETGRLVLAGERGEYDVYVLDAADAPVYLDGKSADASALEDGMTVEITYGGDVMTSLPAELGAVESISAWSLGTEKNPGGTAYDLCGLYLHVLNDLWEKDAGLNGGARYVSVDLSAAPGGLSSAAKYAVAWRFADQHDALPLTLTYDELIAQGYLADVAPEGAERKAYQWEDGLLFRITGDVWAEDETYSLPAVKFSADKWRTPLGAYGFSHCTAVWPELGTWSGYNIGGEFIA